LAVIRNQHIEIAVVVKIASGHAPPGKVPVENLAGLRADIFEIVTGILKHQERLFVLHAFGAHLNKIIRMAVDKEEVRITIVVVIEETQSPAAQHLRRRSYLPGFVRKNQVFLIVIETKKFLIDISHKKILPTVTIIVSGVNSHPGARLPGITEGHPGRQSDFFKFAATLIEEQKIWHRIVGYKEIQQAIVVNVRSYGAERFAG